jgi:hypothetical protein
MICIPHQILFEYQIRKNEMRGTCSPHGKREGAYGSLVGKPEKMNQLEDIEADGMIL